MSTLVIQDQYTLKLGKDQEGNDHLLGLVSVMDDAGVERMGGEMFRLSWTDKYGVDHGDTVRVDVIMFQKDKGGFYVCVRVNGSSTETNGNWGGNNWNVNIFIEPVDKMKFVDYAIWRIFGQGDFECREFVTCNSVNPFVFEMMYGIEV